MLRLGSPPMAVAMDRRRLAQMGVPKWYLLYIYIYIYIYIIYIYIYIYIVAEHSERV